MLKKKLFGVSSSVKISTKPVQKHSNLRYSAKRGTNMLSSQDLNQDLKSMHCPNCHSDSLKMQRRLGTREQPPFLSLIRRYQCLHCGHYFNTAETVVGFVRQHHTEDARSYQLARAIGTELRRERRFTNTKLHEEYNPRSSGSGGGSSSYETITLLGQEYPFLKVRTALRRQLMIGLELTTEDARALRDYMWKDKDPSPLETLKAVEPLLSILEEVSN